MLSTFSSQLVYVVNIFQSFSLICSVFVLYIMSFIVGMENTHKNIVSITCTCTSFKTMTYLYMRQQMIENITIIVYIIGRWK